MPRPMKERNASPRMTAGSSRKIAMIRMPSVFGSRWRSEDPVPARAHRLRRAHVVVLLQRQHLAADDARGGEPAGDRERDHHRPEIRVADDRERDDREGQVGQAVERVEETHQAVVEPAADEARDRSVDDADRQDRERGAERDQDRDAAAERGAGEQVAAELVGAEGMVEARVEVRVREDDRVRVVRGDDRREDAVEEHQQEDRSGDDRGLVANVAAPRVAPEVGLGDRRACTARLGDDRLGAELLGRCDHQVRASRVRGSRIP